MIPLEPVEEKDIDASIRAMVTRIHNMEATGKLVIGDPLRVCKDPIAAIVLDEVISAEIWNLIDMVPLNTGDKLFDRLGSVRPEEKDAIAHTAIFVRFWDTMEAMVCFKKKFRGKPWEGCKYTKEEAFGILSKRGLTKRNDETRQQTRQGD